ncbi:MAG: PAS domain S-box protein [Cyanobacteria bacterium J06554_11]
MGLLWPILSTNLPTALICWGFAAAAYRLIAISPLASSQKIGLPPASSTTRAKSSTGQPPTPVRQQLPDVIFQQAIEHAAGGLVICDAQQPDLPIIYASPSFETLTGYSVDEVLGRNCRFLQGREINQLGTEDIRQAIASGTGCKVLIHNYRKNGQPFWNELTLSPLVDAQGTVTHYLGTQIDISHYLDTFKALQQSEARYRHLYQDTPAMLHSVDRQGQIVSMSHFWLETLGYTEKEVIGQPLSAFLADCFKQEVHEILLTLESDTVDRNRPCQFIKKDGTYIDVLLSTMAERQGGQHAGRTLGVIVDVTEQTRAKESLRRSEALLRAINNLPPTGIFVMDCDTNDALFINSEFYRIWQLEHLQEAVIQGNITGEQLLTECLSNIDLGEFVAASTGQDFTHGNKIVEDEVPLLDGRTLRRIYGPIQENNSTFAYLYVFEDITERKQAIRALAEATAAAETANRAKSEFLANMSHELRSPLNVILGFTHILKETNPTQEQKENLDIIYSSGEHLLALINDILDISKIEAGRVVVNCSRFDLYRLLDELQQMFSNAVAQKDLQLVVERSPDLPRIIESDRLKLRQVLINLLSNAVKFTHTGTITLKAATQAENSPLVLNTASPLTNAPENGLSSAPDQNPSVLPTARQSLIFSVTDTGPGIAPADQQRLFEAFFQTQSGLTAHEGTGLGLTISQEYIQLLGGKISVNSTLHKGTTFAFSIDVALVDSAAGNTLCNERVSPTGRITGLAPGQPTYRILVVDDVALNRKLLTNMLSAVGFTVKEATNGEEAIALWRTWQPQLIWMDVRMPVMNGEEAALRIRALDPNHDTCLIALTANAFDEDRKAALANGCDDFISKPIQAAEIFQKMSQHIGVQYRYAQPNEPQTVPIAPLTADLLKGTSKDWQHALTQAILDLDDAQILDLLNQLSPAKQDLAQSIKKHVNNMSYKKLLQLLHEAEAVSP